MLNSKKKDIIYDILKTIRSCPRSSSLVISDVSYTYEQFGRKIGGMISFLEKSQDEVVGIIAENNIETYASILAVLLCGKTYVILHPAYPSSRNLRIARLSGLKRVLLSKELEQDLFGDIDVELVDVRTLEEQEIQDFEYKPDSTSNAYIIFTSGSTAEPKGVPITRDNLNAFYNAYTLLGWELSEQDRMLQMFELTFDVSVVSLLYPLAVGASVYTVGYNEVKHVKVFDLLETYELTFAAITPSVLQLLSPYFSEVSFPALKYLIVTAESSQVELLQQFRNSAPNAQFVNLYGPTEATIYCTSYKVPRSGIKQYNGMVAIGKPFAGVDIIIADENGNILPYGEMGELWVSGEQVMSGYVNDPEKTSAVMVHRPDGKNYYKTGDLCILDSDGDIIYCGRKDYQIKIHGFRIELSEIEYTAKQFFSNACNVVVIPVGHDGIYNELHLVVEALQCEDAKLQEYLKDRLPKYMLPSRICCIPQFPTTSSNKTDRNKIAQLI